MADELQINKEIDELRERIKTLQKDRSTNIEIWESAKKSNSVEYKKLREENKELRNKIATLQQAALENVTAEEQRHVEVEVENLRRTYNSLAVKAARLKKQFESLASSGVSSPSSSSKSPLAGLNKKGISQNNHNNVIRRLENTLDSCLIRTNEALAINKTLTPLVQRIRDERVHFENILSLNERSVAAKRRDLEEVQLLSGEAVHAKQVALHELDRLRLQQQQDRKSRELQLRETTQMVQMRKQVFDRYTQRELLRKQLNEAEQVEKSLALFNLLKEKTLLAETVESRGKLDMFEDAFRRIKDATGVSNSNEIIRKLSEQTKTTDDLVYTSKENQQRIEQMHQQYRQLKIELEELKYINTTGTSSTRQAIELEKENLNNSQQQLKTSQQLTERLQQKMTTLQTGVGHLQEQVSLLRFDLGGLKVNVNAEQHVNETIQQIENLLRRANIEIMTSAVGLNNESSDNSNHVETHENDLLTSLVPFQINPETTTTTTTTIPAITTATISMTTGDDHAKRSNLFAQEDDLDLEIVNPLDKYRQHLRAPPPSFQSEHHDANSFLHSINNNNNNNNKINHNHSHHSHDSDNEDDEDDVNTRHARNHVKKASAEILRKMEKKRRDHERITGVASSGNNNNNSNNNNNKG